ncbi:MAG: tRNA lysidine(34) synthetase TilS [Planctomycetota bacterium]
MDAARRTPEQLAEHVRGRLVELAPESREGPLVVAVSGGADSGALAALVARGFGAEAAGRLVLVHVAHGWHEEESALHERDAVDALAQRLRLPVVHTAAPWHGVALRRTEGAARRWRYATLERVACGLGARLVLTGHHRRDQAETVCLRARRGSGRAGLCGMAPRRRLGPQGVSLVRPLLDVDPAELRAVLEAVGIAWFEDPSNVDARHDRARLRMGREDPARDDARIAAFAARQRRRLVAREGVAQKRLRGAVRMRPLWSAVELDRAAWGDLTAPLAEAMWRWLGRQLGADQQGPWLSRAHLAHLDHTMVKGGGMSLPRGVRLHARGPRAWLWRDAEAAPRAWMSAWRGAADDGADVNGAAAVARIDARRAGSRPVLRQVREGDRFRPAGREPDREADVLAWMKRRGIPAFARARQLVVEADREIAWVVGLRVDRRFLVAPGAQDAWHLRVEPRGGAVPYGVG